MKKLIIINLHEKKEMTFEEVLVKYRPLIRHEMFGFRFSIKMEEEDMYQLASMGLWQAYQHYNSDTGTGFGVLAKTAIQNKFKEVYNYNNRKKRSGLDVVSIDRSLVDKRDVERSIMDTLVSSEDIQDTVVAKHLLIEFNNNITDQQKETIYLYSLGKKTKEIAQILGIGKSAVHMRMLAAKKVFKKVSGGL